jgi:hypothetical protein
MTPSNCPVLEDTARISGLSHDLVRTLRKLRRDLLACRKCSCFEACPILADFNSKVQLAISEVSDEWDCTPPLLLGSEQGAASSPIQDTALSSDWVSAGSFECL